VPTEKLVQCHLTAANAQRIRISCYSSFALLGRAAIFGYKRGWGFSGRIRASPWGGGGWRWHEWWRRSPVGRRSPRRVTFSTVREVLVQGEILVILDALFRLVGCLYRGRRGAVGDVGALTARPSPKMWVQPEDYISCSEEDQLYPFPGTVGYLLSSSFWLCAPCARFLLSAALVVYF
jgi:hypothetical protein